MKITASIILLFLISSCDNTTTEKPVKKEMDFTTTTYYLIRHAEKDRTNPDDEDPNLNEEGLLRAEHWAAVFSEIKLDAVYSSNYKRTQQTAQPVARKQNLKIENYDPHKVYETDFFEKTKGKQILVVGHSNTVPVFVNHVLGQERYENIPDSIDGRLYVVTKTADQATSFILNLE
ncbi:SixA phosphatase family protein [Planktosalinus lacus]|uniref:Phosphoglycerate mutase n=1 Tax=Planktosalinus lacus TaxID=1526573 RepID=A0A8J2Y8Y6_9FLAO|nr:phosphoglycerate mutase family protein [Planktosalinus lacus]GGD83792.1 hypothetical protein GCM10011312_04850 [Planktosalinus lacus]